MEELRKFDLTRPVGKFSFRLQRRTRIILVIIAVLIVGSAFMIVLPAKKTYGSAVKTYNQAKKTWEAVKKQNIALASSELSKTKEDLIETQNNLNSLSFLRFIPLINGYYNDADHLVKAGFHALDAALLITDSVKPYADVLGLKGQGSFVMGSAQQRVQVAVMTMGKITPRIDDVSKYLILAKSQMDGVDPNHYPPIFGGEKLKNQLGSLKTFTNQSVTFVEEARPLIKVLPDLLGEPKEKKYLVLFQNDKELRPTGGFLTAYAIFRVEHGIIHIDSSNDIYTLDGTIYGKSQAPRPILEYLPKVSTFNLRDSNLSPDFAVSMQTFEGLYKRAGGFVKVDGIIAVDTQALVAAIDVLGDIQTGGMTFTTKNDKRCNCPQVIYELEAYADQPVGYIKANRKGLIGDLMYAIMNKAFSSSPKLYWGPLFQTMLKETSEKHILFYLYNQDAQKGIEALNAAGRIKAFDGDYLHINDTNFAGAKSNMYVKESVLQDFKVEANGTITKTVTISYKNPYPPSDCNLERGGLCLNAILRDWLRIYVPKGSELIESKGSEVKVTSGEELGKTVFEGFLTVRPQGTATFTIKYRLPFRLESGSPLPLLIQKQPGTDKNEYSIIFNGREVEKFQLATDKELRLK